MKKVFFTALALVAMSSASMANTIDDEKKQLLPCTQQWSEDVDTLMDGYGATFEEACVIADRCFEQCLDELYGN